MMVLGCSDDSGGVSADGADQGGDGALGADAPPLIDGSNGAVLGSIRAIETRVLGGEGYEAGGVRAFFSASGAEPSWHVETMREGPCRLLEYELGFCDGCNGICVAPN